AYKFVAEGGNPLTNNFKSLLLIADAATGAILYQENRIQDIDVTGHVSGIATTGSGAFVCDPNGDTPIPYAKVAIGATTAFCDVNGNFPIPNAGSSDVTVNSTLMNPFFTVANQSGPTSALSATVTPPGPANFQYDPAPATETKAAEINTLIAATL